MLDEHTRECWAGLMRVDDAVLAVDAFAVAAHCVGLKFCLMVFCVSRYDYETIAVFVN